MSLIRLGSAATRRQQHRTTTVATAAETLSGTATTAKTKNRIERAFESLVQYIPTENITLFLAAVSVPHSLDHVPAIANSPPLYLVALFTILTPIMLLLATASTFLESKNTRKTPTTQNSNGPRSTSLRPLLLLCLGPLPFQDYLPNRLRIPKTSPFGHMKSFRSLPPSSHLRGLGCCPKSAHFLTINNSKKEFNMIVAEGRFEGRGGHELLGDFVIEIRGNDPWLVTSDVFYFDGSPEPGFAISASLSPSGAEAAATRFLDLPNSGSLTGPQIEVTGKQEARISPDLDLAQAAAVFLWCFKTPFLLGIGQINPVDRAS